MKRTDIDDNFYQKDRNSSKGTKKNFLNESDKVERKRKIAFKKFLKNQDHFHTFDEGDYNDIEDED